MGAPSASTLSFAAGDIPNGLPNEGVLKSSSMPLSSCTAPANLKLTGQALVQSPAAPPRSGFDHFINYRAVGTFNTGTVTLDTTQTSQTVSTSTPIGAANAVVSGTVGVEVNLKRNQPIIAGSYSTTLVITLEPAP